MNPIMTFNSKLDKSPVPISELVEGQLILAKVRFNSKRIIFQPCYVVSPEVVPNHNKYPSIVVRTLLGTTQHMYVRDKDGVTVVIDIVADTKKIQKWIASECNKLEQERMEITQKLNKYNNL